MIEASPLFADFIRAQIKNPALYVKVQTPTPDGLEIASQFVLKNVISGRLNRTQDPSSDTFDLALVDDKALMSSMNPASAYGFAFAPGVIDNKFLVYMGFSGQNFINTPNFYANDRALLLKFTGYNTVDEVDPGTFKIDKNISLIDLSHQFRFPVADTFPHPLYGDQNNPNFDPFYNLTNPSGDGITWVCPAKMFTTSNQAVLYGSNHIDPLVFIDTTGGANPTSTPLDPTGWTITPSGNQPPNVPIIGSCATFKFDYHNAVVTLTTAVSSNSIVSMAGNPTYLAPEMMIYNLLVNYAAWDPNFLNLDPSNILLPMYEAKDKSIWDCLKEIAGMTNPRLLPWIIWTDANGVVNFYESRIDGPPVKTMVDERDCFKISFSNSSVDLRTVVRADATVLDPSTGGDQPITSIAYDVDSITKFGQTEPLNLTQEVSAGVRHLTIPQAVSYLNQYTAAALAQVSRPRINVTAEIWADPTLQISDKLRIKSKASGIDKEFVITGVNEEVIAGQYKQTLTLQDYYDSINYMIGLPAGVAGDIVPNSGITPSNATPPPASSLIGAVRLGTGTGTYAFLNGQYNIDTQTGDQILPVWDINGGNMHFDVFLNSLPLQTQANIQAAAQAQQANSNPQYGFNNLPPGYTWTPVQNYQQYGSYVWAYTAPDGVTGYTIFVGQDNVFYRYNHSGNPVAGDPIWTPTGNTQPSPAVGGTQGFNGTSAQVYLWQWWYLNLDSSYGKGKFFRLVQRPYANDGQVVNVPATNGQWVTSTWTNPPGPSLNPGTPSFLYGNIAVGITDVTATPPGFVGANVTDPNTHLGVAFGLPINGSFAYVGYQKFTRGHYCIYAANGVGAVQFMRIPFVVSI